MGRPSGPPANNPGYRSAARQCLQWWAGRHLQSGLSSLSPEAELVVYRVAQEALTNVARHAQAGAVELRLALHGDRLVLHVTDDGTGGAVAAAGAGITGMRERAQMVGGQLRISGREQGGTEVRLEVPAQVQRP